MMASTLDAEGRTPDASITILTNCCLGAHQLGFWKITASPAVSKHSNTTRRFLRCPANVDDTSMSSSQLFSPVALKRAPENRLWNAVGGTFNPYPHRTYSHKCPSASWNVVL